MIAPTYRRDQLWGRARRGIHPAIVLGACAGTLIAILTLVALTASTLDVGDDSPSVRVDPWGHAMHYTCDPRVGLGAHFAVISAGEDGVFGTTDDIEAHQ